MMIWNFKRVRTILSDAFTRFQANECPRFGASIAYYAVFSLVPLIVIVITVAGFFFGKSGAEEEILSRAHVYLGDNGREFIEETVRAANDRRVGPGFALLSIALILISAAAVFKELKDALNRVFDVPKAKGGFIAFLKNNTLLFGLVLAMGFLLLVSLVLSAALSFFTAYFNEFLILPTLFWQILNFFVSIGIITGLFMMLYRFLPDTNLPWRSICFGSVITAILFTLGKSLIGFYLAQSDPASAYGAAGTLVLILLWTFYSAQIVLFGAELTAMYATYQGRLAHRAVVVEQNKRSEKKSKQHVAVRLASMALLFFLRRYFKRLFRKF